MRGWPGDAEDAQPSALSTGPIPDLSLVDGLLVDGRFADPLPALEGLDAALPLLAAAADPESLLVALHGRAALLRRAGAPPTVCVDACDVLERTADERRRPAWAATACAMRAQTRLDAGQVSAALADLARVELEQLDLELRGRATPLLLDALCGAYLRLRLTDVVDDLRRRLEELGEGLLPLDRATHWVHWSADLAGRAMERMAVGRAEPDQRLLDRAATVAERLESLPAEIPSALHRSARGVRALAAAYRGQPNEALRLLGQDAFGGPRDLAPLERQLGTLAAMRAHALVGSVATARSLDDGAAAAPPTVANLVLEVCRARERLWLETHAGADLVPILGRLADLLVQLGWQGLDLVADTAREALEHQALRAESRTDALTGVGNRRALDEELRHMLRFSPLPMALVLVDIDDFKKVNDVFTHVVGDEVLRRVAAALAGQLRVGDRLVRYGGDEFVVLLPHTGDQEARHVAQRMGQAIAALPWTELADGLAVGVTAGCAALWSLTGRRPDKDAERLFRRADEALLEAKRRRGSAPAPSPWPARRGRRAAGPPDDAPAEIDLTQLGGTGSLALGGLAGGAGTPAGHRDHVGAHVADAPTTAPVSLRHLTEGVPPEPPRRGPGPAPGPHEALGRPYRTGSLSLPYEAGPPSPPYEAGPPNPPYGAAPGPGTGPTGRAHGGGADALMSPPQRGDTGPQPRPEHRHRAEGWGEPPDPGARWYGVAPPPARSLSPSSAEPSGPGPAGPGGPATGPIGGPPDGPAGPAGSPPVNGYGRDGSRSGGSEGPGTGSAPQRLRGGRYFDDETAEVELPPLDRDEPSPGAPAVEDEPGGRAQRYRRRPGIIDLTRAESNERSPFG